MANCARYSKTITLKQNVRVQGECTPKNFGGRLASCFYASAAKRAKALCSRVVGSSGCRAVRLYGHYFHHYNSITTEANSFILISVIDLTKV